MRKLRFALLALGALGLVSIAARTGRSQESKDNVPPAGFIALFNGKDLTNWQAALGYRNRIKLSGEERTKAQTALNEKELSHWTVKDGVLINDGRGTDLSTIKDYVDFDMYVDWKTEPLGDSGIYLRGIPQVQIWDTDRLDPKKYALEFQKGSGALWNNTDPKEKVPLVKADNPPGEWNTFHIVMKGEKVWVDLNGKKVVDGVVLTNNWDRKAPLPKSGPIELQHHYRADGKPGPLWFKNIYVKELPE